MSDMEIRNTHFWFIDGERLGIVQEKKSSAVADSKYESPTNAGDKIQVHYTSKAVPFNDNLKNTSEIPSQFHEALAFKVISSLYKLPGELFNLQLAQYYDGQYEMAIREAKKYARRNHQQGGVIVPHSY
tara:strand:+ start:1873 stop:2259 length:387 start_codon:yes stop_codon:yes gene_type:complete